MTAVVGIRCRDGIVIGTDSSATFIHGLPRTIGQPTEKLDLVAGRILVAGCGSVGHGQRFKDHLTSVWKGDGQPRKNAVEIGRLLSARTVRDFEATKSPPNVFGALLAFPCGNEVFLCEFDIRHFQPELKTGPLWYCSMGSAQSIIDPFLALMRDVFWREGPPKVEEAMVIVTWALDHAISVNPGGVNGPARVATLRIGSGGKPVAGFVEESVLDRHRSLIEDLKDALRSVGLRLPVAETGPEVPR